MVEVCTFALLLQMVFTYKLIASGEKSDGAERLSNRRIHKAVPVGKHFAPMTIW